MAITLEQVYVGSTFADIKVNDMPTGYTKALRIYLDGEIYIDNRIIDADQSSAYVSITDLSYGSYVVRAEIHYSYYSQQSPALTIVIAPPSNPYYTVTINNNNVILQVFDLPNTYNYIYYQLYDDSSSSTPINSQRKWSNYHTFENLAVGQYRIKVKYSQSGTSPQYSIQDENGSTGYHWIQISGSSTYFTVENSSNGILTLLLHNVDTSNFDHIRYRIYPQSGGSAISSGNIYTLNSYSFTDLAADNYQISVIVFYIGSSQEIPDNSGNLYPVVYVSAGSSTDSYVYIYTGQGSTGWQKAIPYIYTGNGSENGWSKAEAYIYTGQGSTGWQKCGE